MLERIQAIEWSVGTLDLTPVWDAYGNRGTPPYPPDAMLRVVLYELLNQRPSPSQWHRDLETDTTLNYLGRGIRPARSTLYQFRDRARKFIESVHAQLLQTAMDKDILHAEEACLDGTFVRSNASRHRIVNQATLDKRMDQLKTIIDADTRGTPPNIADLPKWAAKTSTGREEQFVRLEQAKEILSERLKRNTKKKSNDKLPANKVFVSTSDPEAVISRDKEKIFGPLYTSEQITDNETGLILATATFVQATDVATIGPMIDLVQAYTGNRLRRLYADAAYTSTLDLKDCDQRKIDLYAPVSENSFTASKRQQKPSDRISREEFHYDVETNTYTCPASHAMSLRHTANVIRFDGATRTQSLHQMSPEVCQACPLFARCVTPGRKSRTITRINGQEFVDAQKAKMTEEVSKLSRTIRAQTAEKTFANLKVQTRAARMTCRTPRRTQTVLLLNTVALNTMTLYRLIRRRSQDAEKPG